jgi:hypothetical protein
VWTHTIQLLIELAIISLRHLSGNIRPLRAVEDVIASPCLGQFLKLVFSLSVSLCTTFWYPAPVRHTTYQCILYQDDDDYIPGIFLTTKLLKHEMTKFRALSKRSVGATEGEFRRRELSVDVVPSPLACHIANHIDHITDRLRGPAVRTALR